MRSLGIVVVGLGLISTITEWPRGLLLLGCGVVFLVIPRIVHPTPRVHGVFYPALLAGSLEALVLSVIFYTASVPNFAQPSDLATSAYYALVGFSAALFFAGLTDYSVHSNRVAIEQKLESLEQRLFGDERRTVPPSPPHAPASPPFPELVNRDGKPSMLVVTLLIIGIALSGVGGAFWLAYSTGEVDHISGTTSGIGLGWNPTYPPAFYPQISLGIQPSLNGSQTSALVFNVYGQLYTNKTFTFDFVSPFIITKQVGRYGNGNWSYTNSSGYGSDIYYNYTPSPNSTDTNLEGDAVFHFENLPYLSDHGASTVFLPFAASIPRQLMPNSNTTFGYIIVSGVNYNVYLVLPVGDPVTSGYPSFEPSTTYLSPTKGGATQSLEFTVNGTGSLSLSYENPSSVQTFQNYLTAAIFLLTIGVTTTFSAAFELARGRSAVRLEQPPPPNVQPEAAVGQMPPNVQDRRVRVIEFVGTLGLLFGLVTALLQESFPKGVIAILIAIIILFMTFAFLAYASVSMNPNHERTRTFLQAMCASFGGLVGFFFAAAFALALVQATGDFVAALGLAVTIAVFIIVPSVTGILICLGLVRAMMFAFDRLSPQQQAAPAAQAQA